MFKAGLVRGCIWFCQKLHLDLSGAAQKFVKSFKRCTWICKGIHVDLSEAVCEFVRSRLLRLEVPFGWVGRQKDLPRGLPKSLGGTLCWQEMFCMHNGRQGPVLLSRINIWGAVPRLQGQMAGHSPSTGRRGGRETTRTGYCTTVGRPCNASYHGESGYSAFTRGVEHQKSRETKYTKNALWRHLCLTMMANKSTFQCHPFWSLNQKTWRRNIYHIWWKRHIAQLQERLFCKGQCIVLESEDYIWMQEGIQLLC